VDSREGQGQGGPNPPPSGPLSFRVLACSLPLTPADTQCTPAPWMQTLFTTPPPPPPPPPPSSLALPPQRLPAWLLTPLIHSYPPPQN